MNNTETNNIEEEVILESPLKKLGKNIKDNIVALSIVVLYIIYLAQSLITLSPTGNTIEQIIYSSAVGLVVAFAIKDILRNQGIESGLATKKVSDELAKYAKMVIDIDPYIIYINAFCDYKNAQLNENAKRRYLSKYGLIYKLYKEQFYEKEENKKVLNKKQIYALQNVEKVHVKGINFNLLVTGSTSTKFPEKIGNITNYKRSKKITSAISAVLIAVVFGLYAPTGSANFNLGEFVWKLIQITIWLFLGILEFVNAKSWVKNTYIETIKLIEKYLTECKDMILHKSEWVIEFEKNNNIGIYAKKDNDDESKGEMKNESKTDNETKENNNAN